MGDNATRLKWMARDLLLRIGGGFRFMVNRPIPADGWNLQLALEKAGTAVLASRDLADITDSIGDRYVMTPELKRVVARSYRAALCNFQADRDGENLIDRFDADVEELVSVFAERDGVELREITHLRGAPAVFVA